MASADRVRHVMPQYIGLSYLVTSRHTTHLSLRFEEVELLGVRLEEAEFFFGELPKLFLLNTPE
jgi:hypothetical protein